MFERWFAPKVLAKLFFENPGLLLPRNSAQLFFKQDGSGEFLLENEVRRVSFPETALGTAKSNWFISFLYPHVSGEHVSFL